MADSENELYEYSNKPDIEAMQNDFDRCRRNLTHYVDIAEEARDIRRNNWVGKTKSSRKEHEEAFPWQGASDLEANLVAPLIDGDIALLKSSISKGNLVASPVESGDITTSAIVSSFMRWRLQTTPEFEREVSIGANFLLEQGITFFHIGFRHEVTRVLKPITLEEISALSPQLGSAIPDDDLKEGVLELFQDAFPNLSKKRINKMIRELKKDGATEIPTEKVVANRPTLRALELGRDIVVDSNILDVQSARAIYVIHHYTPEQLKSMINTQGFDSNFVDEVIENTTGSHEHEYTGYSDTTLTGLAKAPDHFTGLIRLISCYRREIDEDGIPTCVYTCFSEKAEGYAKSYTMSHDDGSFPFVAICREQISRRLLDTRGYPEILRSYQDACKSELDSRRDRASLSTCPPLEFVHGRRPERIGAGSQLSVRRRGEVGFLEIPKASNDSLSVEMQIRTLADKLTGRATGKEDEVEANVLRQSLVNNWLHGFSQILKKMWALDREYNQEVFFRVSNNAQGQNIILDDMGSTYDFTITFNSINNDEERVIQKLEMVGKIMSQFDRQGTARYDVYIQKFLDAIDPNLASQLIMPQEEATTKEIEECSSDLAKIASGQNVNAPQKSNAPLRLQILESYVQGTEQIPADDVQERLQTDERFRQRLENYRNQLTFQIQQQENARTGQLGAPEGNFPASVAA